MIIGLAIPSLNSGGAERVICSLANHWADEGHEIHIFKFTSGEAFFDLDNKIEVHTIETNTDSGIIGKLKNLQLTLKQYKLALKSAKIEQLISFMTIVNIYSIMAARKLKIPVVISERNNLYNTPISFPWNKLRQRLFKKANAIVLQTTDSEKCFKDLSIPLPDNKTVIANPLAPNYIRKINLNEKSKKIIHAGRFDQYKQQDLFIEAIAKLDLKDWNVELVGDGPNRAKVEALMLEKGLQDQVSFLGKRQDLDHLFKTASIFVMTSNSEGFPNVLCEAMASACAPISFDCQFGPKDIINTNNGLLIEVNHLEELSKAIQFLMDNDNKRRALAQEALDIQEDLNLNIIADQWMKLFQSI